MKSAIARGERERLRACVRPAASRKKGRPGIAAFKEGSSLDKVGSRKPHTERRAFYCTNQKGKRVRWDGKLDERTCFVLQRQH